MEYSVSSYGRIRSELRNVFSSGTDSRYTVAGRVLRLNWCGSVNFSRCGARQRVITHGLAAAIFSGRTNRSAA